MRPGRKRLADGNEAARHKAYRSVKKNELESLMRIKEMLQKQLQQFLESYRARYDGRLPWKDVAIGLRADGELPRAQNRSLKNQVREYQQLVEQMTKWVHASLVPEGCPDPLQPTWRNVTLLESSKSRALGKEWITKQLYHNADRMFRRFPQLTETIEVEFNEEGTKHTLYSTRVIDRCISRVCKNIRAFAPLILKGLLPDRDTPTSVKEETDSTTLHHTIAFDGDYMNLVVGEFHEMNRSFIVLQQIQHDDTWPESNQQQRHFIMWVELTPIGPNQTLKRYLSYFYQRTTAHGLMPWELDAKLNGIDMTTCPIHLREQFYRERFVSQTSIGIESLWQRALSNEMYYHESSPHQ